jgi:S-adenosylmethionine hydrolase
MNDPLITLTTDFGTASPYVAAMKGVILSLNPAARLVDLSHDIPPQDVRHAAFFLAGAVRYFPAGTIHVVVVDPGVGTERAVLYVELGKQRLLVPDNGCWKVIHLRLGSIIRVTNRNYWRNEVSNTFHGRDIFAPVAAHLSLGVDPVALGEEATEWANLDGIRMTLIEDGVHGEVVFVDTFGNLITNIVTGPCVSRSIKVTIGDIAVTQGGKTYGDAAPGTLIALRSSFGLLEIAEVQGSAAKRLSAKVGTPVVVRIAPSEPEA